MSGSLLIAYAFACFALVFMPGPDILFVLTESLSKGWRRGVLIVCGLVSGVPVHTAFCAAGVSIIIRDSEFLFNLIQLAGAAYLLWLAWCAAREGTGAEREEAGVDAGKMARSSGDIPKRKIFARGFIMNISNPKVMLFFLAFLPQFLTPGGFPTWIQMSVLGAIFMATGFVGLVAVAFLASFFARLFKADAFWIAMKWLKVAVFGLLGAAMVLETALAAFKLVCA